MLFNRFQRGLSSRFLLAIAASVAVSNQAARGGGVVDTFVQSTDANPISVDVNQKDLRQVSGDIINNKGPYAGFANRPLVATIGIAGAKNLLQLKSDATGQNLSLTDLRTGRVEDFVGAKKEQAVNKLTDFLTSNLNEIFGGFQKSLNSQTTVGVTDGNPLAATAFLADDVFKQFGTVPTVSQAPKVSVGRFSVGLSGGGGSYGSNNGSGNFAKFDLDLGTKITDQIGFVFSLPLAYRTVGGTNTYIGGVTLGVPITILHHDIVLDGLAWQLTPWADIGGGINEPLLSGGGVYGGGGTSSLSYQVDAFTFTLADQIGYDSGFSFNYDNIKFDTPVNQWILKNGVRGDYHFLQSFYADAGLAYTNFLASAAVRNYLTPTVGVGIQWGQYGSSNFEVNYVGNFGDSYHDSGVQMNLQFRF